MADDIAIAEGNMPVAVATTTTLIFKPRIHLRPNPADPQSLLVGDISIPKEPFQPLGNSSELELKPLWQMDQGERVVVGLSGLQRRISSRQEGSDDHYFIPSCYLIGFIER